jgi:hypothetical protein
MINFQLNLRVPGSNRFRHIMTKHGVLPFSYHKFWEVQIYKGSDIIDIFLQITRKQDHAGVRFGLGLFGLNLEFNSYDNRHWDKDSGTWAE